jgi:hypothetical protein
VNWYEGAESFSNSMFPAVSVFVGAGLSKPAGLPDWNELIKPYADELGLSLSDLSQTRLMQYACGNNKAKYSRLKQELKAKIRLCNPLPVHRLIARLAVSRIWTTNYDSLLEDAYEEEGIIPEILTDDVDIVNSCYDCPQIVKMHGSLTRRNETDIVLTECEYENYEQNRKGIYSLLQNDMKSKSFLYLGVSFDDPNLRKINAAIWNNQDSGKPGYLLTVPPDASDIKSRKIFDLWETDLTRFGINVIHLDSYNEVSLFLYKVLQQRFGSTAMIIGKHKTDEYKELCFEIGRELSARGYNIHSGGGPNIANFIADGAWSFYDDKKQECTEKVVFYYRKGGGSTNPKRGKVVYTGDNYFELRNKMISPEKICIVIGGEDTGESGMSEEIALARRKGARIIPLATTGSLSGKVWLEDKHYFSKDSCLEDKENEYLMLNDPAADNKKLASVVADLADYLIVRNYK